MAVSLSAAFMHIACSGTSAGEVASGWLSAVVKQAGHTWQAAVAAARQQARFSTLPRIAPVCMPVEHWHTCLYLLWTLVAIYCWLYRSLTSSRQRWHCALAAATSRIHQQVNNKIALWSVGMLVASTGAFATAATTFLLCWQALFRSSTLLLLYITLA